MKTSAHNTQHLNEWGILLVLAGIQFTHIMDFMIMMPLGPQLMRILHLSPQEFSFLVSAYTFSASIAGFCASFYIDRFDRKQALLSLYFGFILATLCCALAKDYHFLLIARVLAGAFGGVAGATIFSIIGDVIPEERRGKATGFVMSAFSVSAVAGIPIGLSLATHFTWNAPFLMLTGVSTLIVIGAWIALPAIRGHLETQITEKTSVKTHLKVIICNRLHLKLFFFISMLMLAGFSIIPFISPYMVANVGLSEKDLPYLYLFGGLTTFFTSNLIGRLVDRYGKFKVFVGVSLSSILPIVILTNLPHSSLIIAVMTMVCFMSLVSGRIVPAMTIITSSIDPKYRGSFMSFNSSIQQMASGSAALIAGIMIGRSETGALTHYNLVGMLSVIATFICIYLVLNIQKRHSN